MKVTREEILAAIITYERMGHAAFLAKYNYRSGRFMLMHEGKAYPSKAILGVAAGVASSEFSGGAAHTVRTLTKLGFDVIEKKGK